MLDHALTAAVRERLDAADLADTSRALVVNACTGQELDAQPAWPDTGIAAEPDQSKVFLEGITVAGFRGIGPARRLSLEPGPGLTLLVGRNGSGKSSFAEGLEMALTNTSTRWADRPTVWREQWRNLHQPHPAEIAVDLVGIDEEPRTLTHRWAESEGDVAAGVSALDDGRTLADLEWEVALGQYRPLLSFNELGGMFDARPADLYDAVAALLGVQPLRDAVEVLRQARLADAKPLEAQKKARKSLIPRLRALEDGRADAVLAAIDGRSWDLGAALQALEEDTTSTYTDTARLRSVVALQAPSREEATTAASELRAAITLREQAADTDAGRAARVADLLRQAIECIEHDGALPCPLCGSGTTLDDEWARSATAEAEQMALQAEAVRHSEQQLAAALQTAQRHLRPIPSSIEDAELAGLDPAEARTAWTAMLDAPADPRALADHLISAVAPVAEAVASLRVQAGAALDERAATWAPVAHDVRTWVEATRAAEVSAARAKATKIAEAWLAEAAKDIEATRFEPIATAVRDTWSQLRLSSNVELEDMTMKRSGSRRSLELDVTVDGSDASALGVMSQGELHALALSVFLPRATLDQSPFRFVVLDDPVQAMDPARVDGLARVLDEVAQHRQVVVMTHDARLAEAVQRLRIDATIIEAHRGLESQVDLRIVEEPAKRYISDAFAISHSAEISDKARASLVAQMGRSAIEARCQQIVTARRLRTGESHEQVTTLLAGKRVHDLMALALFDDAGRGGEVFPTLASWGRGVADAFADCKRGTHVGERIVEDRTFLREVEAILQRLSTVAS